MIEDYTKNLNLTKIKQRIRRFSYILILFYVLIIFLSYGIFQKVINQIQYYSRQQQKETLKEKTSMALNTISPVLKEYNTQQISKEEALVRIREIGHSLVYEDEYGKNYVFINNQNGIVYVRPYRPDDELKNLINMQDSKGNYVMRSVIEAVERNPKGAFVEYLFPNPKTKLEEPKLSYAVFIPELNIHIGTGSYYNSHLKKQIQLANDLYFLGLILALLFSIPLVFLFLFNRKQSNTLIKELILNKSMYEDLYKKELSIAQINEYFRITLRSIGDAVISTDTMGLIKQMNPIAENLTGYKEEEAIGKNLKEVLNLINSETRVSIDNPVTKVIETGKIVGLANHSVLISRDKKEYQIADSAAPIIDQNKAIQGVVLVFRDVTEEHELKDLAQKNEIFFKTIIETSPYAIVVQDMVDGKIVMVNNAYINNSGIKLDDAIGKTSQDTGFVLTPEQTNTINLLLKDNGYIENYSISVDNTLTNEKIDLMVSSKIFQVNEHSYILTISNNVTETRRLQEQLNHAQKMDAIGQLAGGVAHDFNNMLGAILGSAEIMMLKTDNPEKNNLLLNNIVNAAYRASDLTKKLLMFSRKGKLESTAVDIHKAIEESIEFLMRSIDKKITIKQSLEAQNYMIIGDFTQLVNVFLNLGINASHAMPQGGSLSFTSNVVEIDDLLLIHKDFDAVPGKFIQIEVLDTGSGIPKEHLSKIFEPFFTTKEQGKGTGLGLAAVYGTVKQHKGFISVYSEIDKGTSFHLYFPLSETDQYKNDVKDDILYGNGCILVVDDEETLSIMAKSILEYLGYSVIIARNGYDAIKLYQDNQNIIDLVLLDMIMPEMNGVECFYALKKLDDKVKVVISSGFSQEKDIEQLKKKGLLGFIKKPYNTALLSKTVADLLDK